MSNIKEKMILKSSSFRPFGLLTISTVYSKSQDYSFCLQISRWWLELKGGNCLQLYRATRVCVTNSYIVCQVSRARATPLKLEKILFFGVKSWFFTRNTPKMFAPFSARRNFFKYAPLLEILDPPLTCMTCLSIRYII